MGSRVTPRVRVALAAVLAAVLASSLLALPGRAGLTGGSVSCAALRGDAIHRRTMAELGSFVSWLRRYHVRGMVGEFGWPDDSQGDAAQWNCLAQDYYAALDRYGLPAAVWAATEMTTTQKLTVYSGLAPDLPMSQANVQAVVVAAHLSTARYLRGVSYSGSEDCFAETTPPSPCTANVHPGVYDADYNYPSAAGLQYLAGQGVRLVVLPFRWERIQPTLFQPLSSTELSHLVAAVQAARSVGMTVMIDMHNFGGYWATTSGGQLLYSLGSPLLPVSAFVDVWRRLSAAFRGYSGVMYRIMNEPTWMYGPTEGARGAMWRSASQAVVNALRAAHDGSWLVIDGYRWSTSADWVRRNPWAWIHDRLGRFYYDMHQYFDLNHSAAYSMTYSAEDQQLAAQ